MTEEVKTSEETEVQDPDKLLAMYRELQADVVTLRKEKKALEEQLETTDEEAVSKWKSRAIKAEAKVNLEAQGIKDADRILKYLNLEGVDFGDDDKLTGFDEKVSEVKKDFPELFDVKRRAGRSSADIHEQKPAEQKMTGTEAQVRRIFAH
jgi:hypothetical protein